MFTDLRAAQTWLHETTEAPPKRRQYNLRISSWKALPFLIFCFQLEGEMFLVFLLSFFFFLFLIDCSCRANKNRHCAFTSQARFHTIVLFASFFISWGQTVQTILFTAPSLFITLAQSTDLFVSIQVDCVQNVNGSHPNHIGHWIALSAFLVFKEPICIFPLYLIWKCKAQNVFKHPAAHAVWMNWESSLIRVWNLQFTYKIWKVEHLKKKISTWLLLCASRVLCLLNTKCFQVLRYVGPVPYGKVTAVVAWPGPHLGRKWMEQPWNQADFCPDMGTYLPVMLFVKLCS